MRLAIALSTVAFTNTAMAGKHGQKGANQNAPGQEWKARKDDAGAVSPGQEWKLRKDDGQKRCRRDNNSNLSALLATPTSWSALVVKARSPRNVTHKT